MSFQQAQLSGLIPSTINFSEDQTGSITINSTSDIILNSEVGFYTTGPQIFMDNIVVEDLDLTDGFPFFSYFQLEAGCTQVTFPVPIQGGQRCIITNNTGGDVNFIVDTAITPITNKDTYLVVSNSKANNYLFIIQ